MKIYEALANWKADIRPAFIAYYGDAIGTRLEESWRDYIYGLHEEGEISTLQCQHCGSWDSIDFDDARGEFAFLLSAMGVSIDAHAVLTRPDGLMDDMPYGSRHWKIHIKRGSDLIEIYWSAGPAITKDPNAVDVIRCMLQDTAGLFWPSSFEEWASDHGYDEDSRRGERIYNACMGELEDLRRMFSDQELEDLRTADEDV